MLFDSIRRAHLGSGVTGAGMTFTGFAAGIAASSLTLQVLSSLLALSRCRTSALAAPPPDLPPVTIVQPLCGVETFSRETLASIFALDYPQYEIVFCLASGADAIAPLVRGFMDAHPDIPSRLLVGDDRVSANPKLNNVVKGWRQARHPWIVIADSNVLMPPDYIQRLLARWRSDTGIVCSPPIGSRPENFAARLECAFLNTYQAKWQYAGERVGYGFAQGKTMLWRRDVLENGGGIEALGAEIAEDAASTKLVHRAGLRAHLVNRPFAQPLGPRRFVDVWRRQLRWARLRRATFAIYFAPEIFTSSVFTLIAATIAASYFGVAPFVGFAFAFAIWYGVEAMLALAAGWPMGIGFLPACVLRDVLLPWLWVQGWTGDRFEWRGNAMTVGETEMAADGPGAYPQN